jgi:hypothetical protein
MKKELFQITKDLAQDKITEQEARNLLLGLLNVVSTLNHDLKVGDDVWITSKKLVTISCFAEDKERVQVEDGCEYYLVDIDDLTKVV